MFMNKILLAFLLLTSCQVNENNRVPAPVLKSTENDVKKHTTEHTPVAKIPPALKKITKPKNKILPPVPPEKPAEPVSAPSSPENKKQVSEIQIKTIKTAPAVKQDSGGGGSDIEGYIPFIKQYW